MNNDSKLDKLERRKHLINDGNCCVCQPNKGCNFRGKSRSKKNKIVK